MSNKPFEIAIMLLTIPNSQRQLELQKLQQHDTALYDQVKVEMSKMYQEARGKSHAN